VADYQTPSLTRSHVWILALAAYQAQIKRLRAVLLHLDHDHVAATASGRDADDVAIGHGCGGAKCGPQRPIRARSGAWCRSVCLDPWRKSPSERVTGPCFG
jgi:hypothetical protein